MADADDDYILGFVERTNAEIARLTRERDDWRRARENVAQLTVELRSKLETAEHERDEARTDVKRLLNFNEALAKAERERDEARALAESTIEKLTGSGLLREKAEDERDEAREALRKITLTPSKPFPDEGAHSVRAAASAVRVAWHDIQRIARAALAKGE
jgi:chromosome segregation ATPase